jgi:3-deoxy-D-manno-octulosonic-acid transferase
VSLPRADIWLHGASAGDVRALAPLAGALRAARPELRLLLTAWTSTGRAMAGRLLPDVPFARPPIDVPPLPDLALRRVAPRLVVLEYLEVWPAWIAACARARVPVAVVDGHLTRKSFRIAPLLRPAMGRLALFCARSAADAEAALALGVPADRVRVHGNAKHDGVAARPPLPVGELRAAVGEVDVVVGSLHADEEAAALPALAASGLTALVAPRYPRRVGAVLEAARRLGVPVHRRGLGPRPPGARWVVLDTVGELAAAYALGRVAVVGGTFGAREGQTLVEPAAHGLPVVHGPRTGNVAEEAAALAGHGAWPVPDWASAFAAARRLREAPSPDPRPALAALRGAVARHLEALLPLLDRDR